MNTFEFNKIAAAVLSPVLFVVVLWLLAGFLYAPEKPAKPGFVIETAATQGAPAPATMPPVVETTGQMSLAKLLKNGDAARGQKVAKKCAACHTLDQGGKNKVGPNLYNVVGRPMASIAGFRYSPAMKAQGAGAGKWSYNKLFGFLRAPKKYLSGTSMGFSGIKSESQRADLVVYLKSISPDAPDLP